jgi:predicted nucleic acid-binding protein
VAAFLLDSNIFFALMDQRKPGHTPAWERLRAAKESVVAVSAIALAEADVGCCMGQQDTSEAREAMAEFVAHHEFWIVPVTKHTAPYYGELKAALIRKYQPKRARWPERWKDKPTGADLQVEEPDLLMAAQAIEHGYVLVTGDGMDRIREVLTKAREQLEFQDWSTPRGESSL